MSRPDETLPSEVDVVVLGTGLPESILAAACARVGFTVLHLDRNEYYGGSWASFNLEGILQFVEEQATGSTELPQLSLADIQLNDGERLIAASANASSPGVHYSNVVTTWHIPETQQERLPDDQLDKSSVKEFVDDEVQSVPVVSSVDVACGAVASDSQQCCEELKNEAQKEKAGEESPSEPVTKKRWTKESILSEWRRFSLDLAPKVLLGRGDMVDLLSHSSVGRYAEFRSVNRLLAFYEDTLKTVPCSRGEVFQSTEITMIEKRMLMKFLTFCLNYDTEAERPKWQDLPETPFDQFLSSGQLTEKLRHYILHSLAMVSPIASTIEGLKSVHEFLMSTGRYGSSPFLWTLYGGGELPQCFCRLCAVFGGIYCLRRSVEHFILDSNGNCAGVMSQGHRVSCRWLVTNGAYWPSDLTEQLTERSVISRAILITDRPMTGDERKENVCLLNYWSDHLPEPVKILEAGAGGCVCPSGLYVVHLTTKGSERTSAQDDLEPVIRKFFTLDYPSEEDASSSDQQPRILWSLFFNCVTVTSSHGTGNNVVITPPVDGHLTYANLVPQLKEEFNRLWPDTEFLPASPNPDEGSDVQEQQLHDPGINGYTPDV